MSKINEIKTALDEFTGMKKIRILLKKIPLDKYLELKKNLSL